jgi:hypothetical protein
VEGIGISGVVEPACRGDEPGKRAHPPELALTGEKLFEPEPGTLIRNRNYFNRGGSGEREEIGRNRKVCFPVRNRVERVDPKGFERAPTGSGDLGIGWDYGTGIRQRVSNVETAQLGKPGRAAEFGAERA